MESSSGILGKLGKFIWKIRKIHLKSLTAFSQGFFYTFPLLYFALLCFALLYFTYLYFTNLTRPTSNFSAFFSDSLFGCEHSLLGEVKWESFANFSQKVAQKKYFLKTVERKNYFLKKWSRKIFSKSLSGKKTFFSKG